MSADDDSPSFFITAIRCDSTVLRAMLRAVAISLFVFGDQFYDVPFPVTELGGFLQPAR